MATQIVSLELNSAGTQIDVSLSTGLTYVFTDAKFWTKDTYKDDAEAVDLSGKLAGSSNSETFSITLADVSLEEFCGLFILEFTSNEPDDPADCNSPTNIVVGAVGHLMKYQECLLKLALGISIDCCVAKQSFDDCNDCTKEFTYVGTMYEVLETAILNGFYQEAIDIICTMDTICEDCTGCPDLATTSLIETIKTNANVVTISA